MKTKAKPITRAELLGRFMLRSPDGFSELEGITGTGFTSGRNEINDLDVITQQDFLRIREANASGGGYFRYFIASEQQAERLINYLNGKAKARNDEPFCNEAEKVALIANYPKPTAKQLLRSVPKPRKRG